MIMAAQEVARHMPGLRKLAARDFPGVPHAKLGYIIDCTTVPLKFSHFRVDDGIAGEGPNQSWARPELRQMALKSEGGAALVSQRLFQGTGCQERDVIVEVKDEQTKVYSVGFKRAVGVDMEGERAGDAVDYILCGLGIRDPVSWLSESATPVKNLCDRIDRFLNVEETMLPAAFVVSLLDILERELS